jgi:homoserine dehydrogenase
MSAKPYRVGLIGFGNIGSGTVRHLMEEAALLAERSPGGFELVAIADREFDRPRGVTPPATTKLTTNWREITSDPTIDGVIELVGVGADGKPTLALEIARAALGSGKDFITANKGLIAPHGGELEALARANNAMLLFEASVGAGIPLIASLQGALAPNRVRRIDGIVNGTCNYILTRLENDKSLSMKAAIKEAQDLGYAEPDPRFDVEGNDSGYKVVILGSLAFGQEIPVDAVSLTGITKLDEPEFLYAREKGLSLKLLGTARLDEEGGVEVSVAPTFLPSSHVLAGVRGVFNAVLIQGEPIGDTMYYGAGAGQKSTGSGLIADLITAARRRREATANPHPLRFPQGGYKPADRGLNKEAFYVRLVGPKGEAQTRLVQRFGGTRVASGDSWVSFVTTPLSLAQLDNLLAEAGSEGASTGDNCIVRFAFGPSR